jgi:hypothetical protein
MIACGKKERSQDGPFCHLDLECIESTVLRVRQGFVRASLAFLQQAAS